jgi:hypothetical protein
VRDDFQRLMEAVVRLQNCIRDMGASADVAEIRLKPTRGNAGRFETERALRASPSYPHMVQFGAEKQLPSNCIAEIAGVRLTAVEL